MPDDKAEVAVEVTGTEEGAEKVNALRSAFGRAADGISSDWTSAGGKMRSALGGAVASIGGSLATLGQDAVRVATLVNNISVASAVSSAKTLDDTLARLSASKGVGVGELGDKFTGLSKHILEGEQAIAGQSRALSRLTGDFGGAIAAMDGLGTEAIATGHTADEMLPLGAVLHNVLGVAGDTSAALGQIRAQAEALGTVGGPAALGAQITSAGGALAKFGAQTDEQRGRLVALMGTLGRGLNPEQAGRVQSGVLGALEGNALEISRTVGHDVLDEHGHLADPVKAIRDLDAIMKRRGLSKKQQLKAYRRFAGVEGGSELFAALQRGDLTDGRINELAGLAPSASGHDAAGEFADSKAGSRLITQLNSERAARHAAEPVLDAQDAWGRYFQDSPVASALAGNLLGATASSLLKFGGARAAGGGGAASAVAKALSSGAGSSALDAEIAALPGLAGRGWAGTFSNIAKYQGAFANAGARGAMSGAEMNLISGIENAAIPTAVKGVEALDAAALAAEGALVGTVPTLAIFGGALAGATVQLGTLATIGEDRDAMGKKWREEHDDVIEAEKEQTPYAIRKRREKRQEDDTAAILGYGRDRSDINKRFGQEGFEESVKAYDPALFEREQSNPQLQAIVKALSTGKTDGLPEAVGKAVGDVLRQNPVGSVEVQNNSDHPVSVVKKAKASKRFAHG